MIAPEAISNKATANVALYSVNNSLQTGLLAKLISQELELNCNVYREFSAVPSEISLLLIDCQGENLDSLNQIARDINEHCSGANAALLNAEYDSEHENLLDWPCISGLFYADSDQDQLLRGLRSLLDGDYWVPRRLLHHFLDKNRKVPSMASQPDVKLTKRERQILKLINDGATNADIAGALTVSEHTVKSHLYNVYKKIGVRNRLEASNWARNMPESELS
ncbi:LuxR C-terminal-related transcriptional regulator [Agaribacterium haliotis]|uniref:LuxR C-terminal-related transcriptional regulator n=1 Tax=Agaribacterium haliotis TaxID=2013869 RepID=UPI000BB560D8|nr:LuxR C-terminal-related transcriptional regulator [Agaribacterium haliotis]